MDLTKCCFVIGCISSGFGIAGTMGEVATNPPVFFQASSGYSFPYNEKLKVNVPSNPFPMVVDLEGSVFFAAEIGYRFHPHLSVGLEAAYRPDYLMESYNPHDLIGERNLGSSPAKALTFMVNGYLNGNSFYQLTPYITGGIGFASTWLGDINVHNERTNEPVFYQPKGNQTRFAWQAGAGINYALTQHIALDLRGRFINFDRSVSKGIKTFPSSVTGVTSFPTTDHNLLQYNAFELGLGLIAKCD